ncbi:hypothetical protein H6G08_10655 [Calothrix anomala FACHB-343]|uniref:DUF11 domain-containing protein n=2 Tax=Calothrix TaxID=1186 RepID=A0ABR8A2M3_9CYAN|nr:hypothetical protein [Calothrix parietina FACHB-288]MBD2224959.1 hypothetical protein [Calothrix anomala FACHB-343]
MPGGGSVQITFVANVPNTVAAGQYQNTATATYLDPQRTTTTGTTNATYSATSSTSEDVTVLGKPKLLLVKRITRINTQDINDLIDGRSDVAVTASNYVAPAYAADDNDPKWPSNYLRGAIKTNAIPQDELEYTIYFLSNGDNNSTNVKICDLVPQNTTFVPNAFNGQTPNDGGLAGADQGIALAIGSTNPTVYLSNIQDSSDRGRYYSANDSSTPSFCGSNINGAVVVNVTRSPDLANLPQATGTGTPSNSYGFVRFRAKVK